MFNVLHVGGREHIGPANVLLHDLGEKVHLTVVEADPDLLNAGMDQGILTYLGHGVKVIPKALSNYIGKGILHINADPAASSLYPINPSAASWQHPCGKTWGQLCETKRTVEVDVTTVDELIKTGEMAPPDFISLNAQGSEHDILRGAQSIMPSHVLGVATEVEYYTLYEGQKQFSDIDALLRENHFLRSSQVLISESWRMRPEESLTVVVQILLWLRDYHHAATNLAALSYAATCFGETGYAEEIAQYAKGLGVPLG